MLNKTTAALENRQPCSSYRVSAPEEHLLGSVLLRSSTRVGAPEEPGSVLLRSRVLRSRVGDSQERPSTTYPQWDSNMGPHLLGSQRSPWVGAWWWPQLSPQLPKWQICSHSP